MLVLGRKELESVWIFIPKEKVTSDFAIRVQLVEVRGRYGRTRIGIEAPDEIHIVREELLGPGEILPTKL